MGIEILVGGLFLVTLLAGIGFAVWSKSRTEKLMDEDRPKSTSPLARETADPKFKPDDRVTDPHNVT
ncbi:hypothetical protein [Jannaschia donghaensis]|uniref:Uncharacterized protein n=1 Tax=Jannaschia donghaensis TaxID=420998 RepID=A0A0M6YLM6_9RHOB|nr:hypothetical protein [Jannaschia donghaensis]CTQ50177.1 hypothetical protein JDO7802_02195 [Jannaschia donghaensis]